MTDTQIVHIYRLDRESIYELYHELEAELARPTLFQFHISKGELKNVLSTGPGLFLLSVFFVLQFNSTYSQEYFVFVLRQNFITSGIEMSI
jgi:hypothetical protein